MSKSYVYYHDLIYHSLGNPGNYLRGINQKRLFARKRKRLLKRAIARLSPYSKIERPTAAFTIEIEFDHFIDSLRSSIEKLMQLINLIADLKLSPTNRHRKNKFDKLVTLDEVIKSLQSSSDTILNRLGAYLLKEKQRNWYTTLHQLRIEIYHNSFEKFIIRDDRLFVSLLNRKKTDLLNYCDDEVANVERFLSHSLSSLYRFKHIQ